MRRTRWLRYVLLIVLIGILASVAGNLLFRMIFNSGLLFGGLVALLLICGLATMVISAREVFRP